MVQIVLEDGEEAVQKKVTKDGRITGLGKYTERTVLVVILKQGEIKKGAGDKGESHE